MSGPARSWFVLFSRVDVRSGKNLIRIALQRQHGDHDTIFRQMLAVTQDDISYITNAESVDHDGSGVDFASYCCAVLIEFHDITGIHEEDVLFRDAEALCYFCVCF